MIKKGNSYQALKLIKEINDKIPNTLTGTIQTYNATPPEGIPSEIFGDNNVPIVSLNDAINIDIPFDLSKVNTMLMQTMYD